MPQPFVQSSSDLSPQSSGYVDSARSSVPASVGELLASATGPLFSFEFFPPRSEEDEPVLWAAVEALAPHEPAFVSVTYGANGSRRDRTVAATRRIASSGGPLTVGHLTCVDQSKADIASALAEYRDAGVTNILAIRGDMPGGGEWRRHPDGLANATELVRFVKEQGDFCVGVAAFPNPHETSNDADLDARILCDKVEAGAEFAITQLFYDAERYGELLERMRDERLLWVRWLGQLQVDPEVGEPDVGRYRQPASTDGCSHLLAVPVNADGARDRPLKGAGAGGRDVEIPAQVLDAHRRGLLGAQLRRVERREHDDLPPRPGDGDVEPSLSPGSVQRAEVQRQDAALVDAERRREQHDVAFIALDVLEILHEQAVAASRLERLDDAFVARVADERLDVGALLLVEGDHADRRHGALRCVREPSLNLLDDGLGLDRIRALELPAAVA